MNNELTNIIKGEAINLGFSFCSIAKVNSLDKEAIHLKNWLKNNYHGEMAFMENNLDKRINPELLFDNAMSIICVGLNYFTKENKTLDNYKIAKFAYGKDYHYIIKERLGKLINIIKKTFPDANARAFVDSAPVMDKAWAQRSGMGWMGKNTCLLNKKTGSFFFIGEIIIDLELEYDQLEKDHCGTCTKCIDACPTSALIAPYILDARKCISYLTIENKNEELPVELKDYFHNNIFGCDICQDVCPWNIKFAKAHNDEDLKPIDAVLDFTKKDWEHLTQTDFKVLFKNTSLERTGYKRLMRNINFLKK